MIKYSVLLAVIFKVLGSTTNPRDVGGSERRHSSRGYTSCRLRPPGYPSAWSVTALPPPLHAGKTIVARVCARRSFSVSRYAEEITDSRNEERTRRRLACNGRGIAKVASRAVVHMRCLPGCVISASMMPLSGMCAVGRLQPSGQYALRWKWMLFRGVREASVYDVSSSCLWETLCNTLSHYQHKPDPNQHEKGCARLGCGDRPSGACNAIAPVRILRQSGGEQYDITSKRE
jgi:hypothetical protein